MYLCSWSLHGHCVFLTVLARTLGILNRQTYAFRDYPCTKSLRIAGDSYRTCSNAYRTLFFDPFIFLRVGTYYILYHIYDLFHIFIPIDYDLKVLVPVICSPALPQRTMLVCAGLGYLQRSAPSLRCCANSQLTQNAGL